MKTNQDNQRQAVQLAYLAGIIDGEGCIRIKRNGQRGTTNHQYHTTISVGMVDARIPELLKETFGGNVRAERLKTGRTIYRWMVEKRENAIKALQLLSDYLVVKKDQAELALKFESEYVSLRSYSAKIQSETEYDLTGYQNQIQLREESYLKMRKLNAVGAAATTN